MRYRASLIVVEVALLALASCGKQQEAIRPFTSPSTSPSASAEASPTTDPQTGWYVHRSEWETATFLYPPDWTAVVQRDPMGDGSTIPIDSVHLTSPNGFTVNWVAPLYGIGGGCDAAKEPHIFVDRILSTPTSGSVNPLSIVLLSIEGHKLLAVVDPTSFTSQRVETGDIGYCMFYPVLQSKRKYLAQFMTSLKVQVDHFSEPKDGSDLLTDDQYLALPDVQTALQILRSLRYRA